MIPVSWLLQHLSDVPDADQWLSPSEREVLARFWAPKRRRDWRLGRWTAKRALARMGVANVVEADPTSWTRMSVRATQAGGPCALLDETGLDWFVSLSHSGEYGFCAVARRPAVVGCDIETVGRRGEEFVVDWFTEAERGMVRAAATDDERSRAITLVWSAKESALKALGVGLRLDTRQVEVELTDAGHRPAMEAAWSPMLVHAPDRLLHGWWQAGDDRVMTIVADPAPAIPARL
jgi:4'-phosphopantetheinyl transferase